MVRVGSSRFLRFPRLTVMLLCPITCCNFVSEPVLWKTSMAPVCLNEYRVWLSSIRLDCSLYLDYSVLK